MTNDDGKRCHDQILCRRNARVGQLRVRDCCGENLATDLPVSPRMLTPQPQHVTPGEGHFSLRDHAWTVSLPDGPDHEYCRECSDDGVRSRLA